MAKIKPVPKLMAPRLFGGHGEYKAPPEKPKTVTPHNRTGPLWRERAALSWKLGLGLNEYGRGEIWSRNLQITEDNYEDMKRFVELGGTAYDDHTWLMHHAHSDNPEYIVAEQRVAPWAGIGQHAKMTLDVAKSAVRTYELTKEADKSRYRTKMLQEFQNIKSGLEVKSDKQIIKSKRKGSTSLNTGTNEGNSQGGLGIPV